MEFSRWKKIFTKTVMKHNISDINFVMEHLTNSKTKHSEQLHTQTNYIFI